MSRGEDIFSVGKFTDLQDLRQLSELNNLLSQILARLNQFDPNSFSLAWIEGYAAGAVIASAGVTNAPQWEESPTLTGLTLTGLTGSKLVRTTAGKVLSSDPKSYIEGVGTAKLTVSATEPTGPAVGDIWLDSSP